MQDFTDLTIWQKGHELTQAIYQLTKSYPQNEQFGLTSQLRRAAFSVPANIAEGFGRNSTKDFINFLVISRGSLQEVRNYLLLSRDLHLISESDQLRLDTDYHQLRLSITAFINHLKSRK